MGSSTDRSESEEEPPALTFPQDQQLLDALGSEALIIQNKRGTLTNEATNRSSLFVAIVSGSLVAAGFVLRTTYAFSFLTVVLPIVLVLGTVTFFRLAAIARDDRRLDSQLEWLRAGFRGLSPHGAAYFLRPEESDRARSDRGARIAAVTTSAAGFIGFLDAALLGLGVALLLGIVTASPASVGTVIAGLASTAAAAVAVVVWLVHGTSPASAGADGTPAAAPADRSR